MQQRHLDQAVAQITGESISTIRQRGFGLLPMKPDKTSVCRQRLLPNRTSATVRAHQSCGRITLEPEH